MAPTHTKLTKRYAQPLTRPFQLYIFQRHSIPRHAIPRHPSSKNHLLEQQDEQSTTLPPNISSLNEYSVGPPARNQILKFPIPERSVVYRPESPPLSPQPRSVRSFTGLNRLSHRPPIVRSFAGLNYHPTISSPQRARVRLFTAMRHRAHCLNSFVRPNSIQPYNCQN
jgi:hypothetical protein